MEHVKAILIKLIMCTAVLAIVLGGLYDVSFTNILLIGALLTGVSYVVGDLFVLPWFENWSASLVDLGLAFISVYFLGSYLFTDVGSLGNAAIISAALIALGEFLFHKYMASHVLDGHAIPSDKKGLIIQQRPQTEHSEELTGSISEDEDNKN